MTTAFNLELFVSKILGSSTLAGLVCLLGGMAAVVLDFTVLRRRCERKRYPDMLHYLLPSNDSSKPIVSALTRLMLERSALYTLYSNVKRRHPSLSLGCPADNLLRSICGSCIYHLSIENQPGRRWIDSFEGIYIALLEE